MPECLCRLGRMTQAVIERSFMSSDSKEGSHADGTFNSSNCLAIEQQRLAIL